MTSKLQETLIICDTIFGNCDIDYFELLEKTIDDNFFDDYKNIRIVNSFLFNFSKLQDKIGTKLFKQVLFELREIDNLSIVMIDVLNILEKLDIVKKEEWDNLREVRNLLAHEYPFCLGKNQEQNYPYCEGFLFLVGFYHEKHSHSMCRLIEFN